jgi:hypothetical protein
MNIIGADNRAREDAPSWCGSISDRSLQIPIESSVRRSRMSRCTWPPSLRQRTFSILMVIMVSTGYRRWLCRPWQWSLRDSSAPEREMSVQVLSY